MGMTITEKILAAHANLTEVEAGQLITAKVDIVLSNDITGPVAIREMTKTGMEKVFDKNKIALIPDHFSPTKDIKQNNAKFYEILLKNTTSRIIMKWAKWA